MTHTDLHNIPNFKDLQSDPRFVGLLMHLRSIRPKAKSSEAHGMIQDSGRLEEYLALLDRIADAFVPPQKVKEVKKFVPYTDKEIQTPLSTENNPA